ncbi:MAG: DUF3107 domain-containing protein [bacterium]
MEIKIGVQQSAREIALDSALSADDIAQAVSAALAAGGVLTLDDEKGRRVIVPADRIAYVEIGPEASRRVGFGT